MNGSIVRGQGSQVSCNIFDCHSEASFEWFFQTDEKQPLITIKGGNIIDFMGVGRYICRVSCGEDKGVFEAHMTDGVIREYTTITQVPAQPNKSMAWDFSKLPKGKESKTTIVAHVTNKEWKKLAQIHNQYQLSPKTICCDMSEVQKEFTAYVESLPAGKGKVVRDSK